MQETMITLTQYGLMAEKHWREFLPRMMKDLETHGRLQEALLEAEEKTKDEMYDLTTRLMAQGLTAQQAHDQAWEMVREEYILLTPEETA
jgi:formate dehydrogenase maturation protein FdhE